MLLEGADATVGARETEVTNVVCFAFADMASIRGLEADLPGDHVHLVPGVDRDVEGLVMHLLHDAPTVVVVVHSPALSSEQLEEVLVTFGKQRGRSHRLCVVEFDPADPLAFLEGVGSAVQDMRARVSSSGVHRSPSASMRARVPEVDNDDPPSRSPDEVPAEVVSSDEPVAPAVEDVSTDLLATTNPGASESGTTFPDLGTSLEQVRRGRERRVRRKRQRMLAVGVGVLAAAAATVWFAASSRVDPTPEVSRATVVPEAKAPARRADPPRPPVPTRSETSVDVPPPAPTVVEARPTGDNEARRVAAALDAGHVRALDALLIRVGPRATERFGDARRRCSRLQVADLDGWRLPSLDELRRLRRARLLPDGEFWSSGWVGARTLFTLDRAVTRPQERERADEGNVRTLCVRQR
jgi:hypothetical protein